MCNHALTTYPLATYLLFAMCAGVVGCGDATGDEDDANRGSSPAISDAGFTVRDFSTSFDVQRRADQALRDLESGDLAADGSADADAGVSDGWLADGSAEDSLPPDASPPDSLPPDTSVDAQADSSSLPPGTLLVDTVTDFSTLQGTKRLSYGYYDQSDDIKKGDGTYALNDFKQMTQISQNAWWVQKGQGGFWTYLSKNGGHPNGLEGLGGRAKVVHWAIRRWRSSYTGWVQITGTLKKVTKGGDGVGYHVFLNGKLIQSTALSGDDDTGFTFVVCAQLSAEQRLDFALTPGSNDNSQLDIVANTIQIHVSEPNCGA